MRQWIGHALARYLTAPGRTATIGYPTDNALLAACVRPGDVILVDGDSRVSAVIKYLTQSTWSHAALYVGPIGSGAAVGAEPPSVVEADMHDGVRAVPLAAYTGRHCRICRPASLSADEVRAVCAFAVQSIGHRYDLKNIVDLARYLLPTLPVPMHWRRHMLALGSGDPTRAICSTLIAQAFESVRYPILPIIEEAVLNDPGCEVCVRQILHVRHYSLYAPRDFDVSPYFEVVKPTLSQGFDHHALVWAPAPAQAIARPA
ncbi:YiiX/YebB-like N1pC/P60 family cysteine hydrolase [Hydrogenophaga sp.]|uniref:YiiX/YebB-like N1pC/P60 family cysteine hydrolase n=1 Tax=Hydrogenophaga sp. TaxID=1904254 RepID=UPI00286E0112|nr:YiiX/YebB-like N1pC/P60 family cysteine hydrolase [Hydrogenophaga sp.]